MRTSSRFIKHLTDNHSHTLGSGSYYHVCKFSSRCCTSEWYLETGCRLADLAECSLLYTAKRRVSVSGMHAWEESHRPLWIPSTLLNRPESCRLLNLVESIAVLDAVHCILVDDLFMFAVQSWGHLVQQSHPFREKNTFMCLKSKKDTRDPRNPSK